MKDHMILQINKVSVRLMHQKLPYKLRKIITNGLGWVLLKEIRYFYKESKERLNKWKKWRNRMN